MRPQRKGGGSLRRLRLGSPPKLAAEADADRSVWPKEVTVIGFRSIQSAIHGAEEKVCAITKTYFRIREFERHAGEAADIRHHDIARMSAIVNVRVVGKNVVFA